MLGQGALNPDPSSARSSHLRTQDASGSLSAPSLKSTAKKEKTGQIVININSPRLRLSTDDDRQEAGQPDQSQTETDINQPASNGFLQCQAIVTTAPSVLPMTREDLCKTLGPCTDVDVTNLRALPDTLGTPAPHPHNPICADSLLDLANTILDLGSVHSTIKSLIEKLTKSLGRESEPARAADDPSESTTNQEQRNKLYSEFGNSTVSLMFGGLYRTTATSYTGCGSDSTIYQSPVVLPVGAQHRDVNLQRYIQRDSVVGHSCAADAEHTRTMEAVVAPEYLVFVSSTGHLHHIDYPVTDLALPLLRGISASYDLAGLIATTDMGYNVWFRNNTWLRQVTDGEMSEEGDFKDLAYSV